MRADTRGVSDTVGFVLVFGLITAVIATAFTGGMAGLESAQQAEQNANVERAFDVLHDNMRDIHRNGAPSRATEIRLSGGTLEKGEQSTITVNNSSNKTELERIEPEAIRYTDQEDTEIVYEAGAVIRSDGDNSVMVNEPDWISPDQSTEGAMLPLVDITLDPDSSRTIGGDTTVQIIAEESPPRGTNEFSGDINITVESPYADAWTEYFRQQGIENDDESDDGRAHASIDADRIRVAETDIRVTFQN